MVQPYQSFFHPLRGRTKYFCLHRTHFDTVRALLLTPFCRDNDATIIMSVDHQTKETSYRRLTAEKRRICYRKNLKDNTES
jgi:hypothetical protein